MMLHSIANHLRIEFLAGRIRPLLLAAAPDLEGLREGECHENAALWVSRNQGFIVVPGWLAVSEFLFEKHSVVADVAGGLLCVTPRRAGAYEPPFIIHQEKW